MPETASAVAGSKRGSGKKRVSVRVEEAENGWIVNVDRADSFEFQKNQFVEETSEGVLARVKDALAGKGVPTKKMD